MAPQPRGQRAVTVNLYFTFEFRSCVDLFGVPFSLRTCSAKYVMPAFKFLMKLRKISRRRWRSTKYTELGHFE